MEVIKIAAIFVGGFLGAGFASGQEICIFFSRFGISGIAGSIISGILIIIFAGIISRQSFCLKNKGYISYLESLFNKCFARFVYVITQIFLFVCLAIMISGSGELMYAQFGIPKILGVIITLLVCFICLSNRIKGVAQFNLIMTPIMIIGIFAVNILGLFKTQNTWAGLLGIENNFFVSAVIYMSYNILTSAAVLSNTSQMAKNKNQATMGGVVGGCVLLFVMLMSTITLIGFQKIFEFSQFPFLDISQKLSSFLGVIYPIVMYMAMLTTAVSDGFCVMEVLNGVGLSDKLSSFCLSLAVLPVSAIKFSSLIENGYILFGILGLVLIFGIITKEMKKRVFKTK